MDNKQKLEYIMRHYIRLMYSAANSILKDHYEAEDACQESLIKLSRIMDRIEDVTTKPARSYVITTTRNTAFDMVRKREHQKPVENLFDIIAGESDYDACLLEAMDLIRDIDELPGIYRDIIHMRCLESKSPGEISKELHLNVSTINSRLSRAREILRRKWGYRECVFCGT